MIVGSLLAALIFLLFVQQAHIKLLRNELRSFKVEALNSINAIYLTPEDRKLLDIPAPTIIANKQEKPKKAVESCGTTLNYHRLSALNLEEYRRKSLKSVVEIEDGKAYVQTCLHCGERFVRSKSHKKDGSREFAWYND